jgi:hypothetical protein
MKTHSYQQTTCTIWKTLLLLCVALMAHLCVATAQDVQFQWAGLLTPNRAGEEVIDLVVDHEGNAIQAHTAFLWREEGARNYYTSNVVFKLSMNGDVLWRHQGLPRIASLTTDANGAVYAVGTARGDSSRPVRADYFERAGIATEGSGAAYVAKFSREGALEWVRLIGGQAQVWMRNVAVDSEGNYYIIGGYLGEPVIGEKLPASTLAPKGGKLFVAKFSPAGDVLWVGASKKIEHPSIEPFGAISMITSFDMEMNLTMVFSLTHVVADFTSSAEPNPGSVIQFSKEGELIRQTNISLPEYPEYRALPGRRTVAPDGSVYSTTRSQTGSGDWSHLTLHKHDVNGGLLWSRQVDTTVTWVGDVDTVELLTDASGNCYWLGSFMGRRDARALTFADKTLVTRSESELFLAKYSPDGELLWVVQTEGQDPFNTYEDARVSSLAHNRFALAPGGRIVLAGGIMGTVRFGDISLIGPRNQGWWGTAYLRYGASLLESQIIAAPALTLEKRTDSLLLSWPSSTPDFVLESTTELESGAWSSVVEGIVQEDGRSVFTENDSGADQRFFRLRRQP